VNLPFFIAKRYLLAKKSHNLINIITWISIIGISVGAFALIVVLSAFNGLEMVVSSMSNRLTPDLQVAPEKGKTIELSAFPLERVKSIEGIDVVVPTITEDALFRANDKQHIGQVKGVGKEYQNVERLDDVVVGGGGLLLSDGSYAFAVPGVGLAWHLGINAYNPFAMMRIYVPKRGNASQMSLENSFNSEVLTVQSVFSTDQEVDENMVMVPLEWLSELLEYEDKVSNIELFLTSTADVEKVKKEVKTVLGGDFTVKDQREQQETLYKVMRSEKWAVYIILTFILILATFNVVGSLSMLMIEKKKDTEILKAMGADKRLIKKIFMNEGMLIAVAGGIIGLLLGIIVVLLQQQFGFVKFGTGGNYVVDAYPVQLKIKDVLLIFATILVVGGTSAFLTVRHAMRRS
jgi:ABC-type lipoprotein release transport system permease subunit